MAKLLNNKERKDRIVLRLVRPRGGSGMSLTDGSFCKYRSCLVVTQNLSKMVSRKTRSRSSDSQSSLWEAIKV